MTWRGLHARCSVVHGRGTTRKPLNTGRADYFGAIPNLAARVCATAQYGQTLLEPTRGLSGVTWHVEDGGTTTGGIHVGPSAGAPEMRLGRARHVSTQGGDATRVVGAGAPGQTSRRARGGVRDAARARRDAARARRGRPRDVHRGETPGGLPIVSKVVGIVVSNADARHRRGRRSSGSACSAPKDGRATSDVPKLDTRRRGDRFEHGSVGTGADVRVRR